MHQVSAQKTVPLGQELRFATFASDLLANAYQPRRCSLVAASSNDLIIHRNLIGFSWRRSNRGAIEIVARAPIGGIAQIRADPDRDQGKNR